jgi:hypothetical protein
MPVAAGLPVLNLVPEREGYNAQSGDDAWIYSKLDGGLGRKRRDKIGAAAQFSVTFKLDRAKYDYFQAFYRTAIAEGSGYFMLDCMLENHAITRLIAQWVTTPELTEQSGHLYVVKGKIEALPLFNASTAQQTADQTIIDAFETAQANGEVLFMPFTTRDYNDYGTFNPPVTIVGATAPGAPYYRNGSGGVTFSNGNRLEIGQTVGAASYSLSVWVRRVGTGTGGGMFLIGDVNTNLFMAINASNQLSSGHAGLATQTVASPTIAVDTPTMLTVTYDEPSTTRKLFINGAVLLSSTSYGANTGTGLLKAFGDASGLAFEGRAVNLHAYDRALSEAEVNALFSSEQAASAAALMAA